jgi:hypothetical protein
MDAERDNNQVTTLIGTSNADGKIVLKLQADPTTHYLLIEDGSSGSDLGNDEARHDNNKITSLLAVSSADGVTPVPLYVNSITNRLLVKST